MFKMVTGGNGRTVYCGKVTRINEKSIEIKGSDYNFDTKKNEEIALQMNFDEEVKENAKNIEQGDVVCITMMPSRKNPKIGIAEEIARNNETIEIQNDKGNDKYIVMAEVRGKKWNEKHNRLSISFLNVTDMEGNAVGYESSYQDKEGNDRTSHWMNVAFFNTTKFENRYNADRADEELNEGDIVALVATKKDSEYNGKTYTNYNGAKYMVIKKNAENVSKSSESESGPAASEEVKTFDFAESSEVELETFD